MGILRNLEYTGDHAWILWISNPRLNTATGLPNK